MPDVFFPSGNAAYCLVETPAPPGFFITLTVTDYKESLIMSQIGVFLAPPGSHPQSGEND